MKVIFRLFVNIYILALASFAVLILFFDKNDIFSQIKRKQELDGLNTKIDYYKQQNESTNSELNSLQNNPVTLEKYAREKFFMKRDNEEIFLTDTTINTEKK